MSRQPLDTLAEKLAAAGQRLRSWDRRAPDEGPHIGRQAISDALHAVNDYLRAVGLDADSRAALLTLHGALADLDKGISNTLLERRRTAGGHPGMGHGRAAQMGHAVACVELLVEAGTAKREAVRQVALRAHVPAATLKGWCDKIDYKPEAARIVRAAALEAAAGHDPARAAHHLLNVLDTLRPVRIS